MIHAFAKAAVGISLFATGKYIARRDVTVKLGNKKMGGDAQMYTAFACIVGGGSLVGAAINNLLQH